MSRRDSDARGIRAFVTRPAFLIGFLVSLRAAPVGVAVVVASLIAFGAGPAVVPVAALAIALWSVEIHRRGGDAALKRKHKQIRRRFIVDR